MCGQQLAKIGQAQLGYVLGVAVDGISVQLKDDNRRVFIRRHHAGLQMGELLRDCYQFGDLVRIRVTGKSFSGRLSFAAIPPARVICPADAPHVLLDASNIARDGEKDPRRVCFGGVGLWTAVRAIEAKVVPEIVADGNLTAVCRSNRASYNALLRVRQDLGAAAWPAIGGAEADGAILRRIEQSGFSVRVLTNDRFRKRKDRAGNVIGTWADLFPWLNDKGLYERLFVRFLFTRNHHFVCPKLDIDVEVPPVEIFE